MGRSRPDIRLHVVGARVNGDGDDVELPQNVRMHGWVSSDRIDDYYRSADALVVPSRWEGFGLVVAALVSDRGGLPTVVAAGRTGYVFSPSPGAIAETLAQLDGAALASMRPACRLSYEKRFATVRFHRDFASLLAELLPVAQDTAFAEATP